MAKRKPILHYVIASGYTDRPMGLGRIMGVTSISASGGLVYGIDVATDTVTRRRATDVSLREFKSPADAEQFERDVHADTAHERLVAEAKRQLAKEALDASNEAWRKHRDASKVSRDADQALSRAISAALNPKD